MSEATFTKGTRVRMTDEARRNFKAEFMRSRGTGTVRGRPRRQGMISVELDGYPIARTFAQKFFEVATDDVAPDPIAAPELYAALANVRKFVLIENDESRVAVEQLDAALSKARG